MENFLATLQGFSSQFYFLGIEMLMALGLWVTLAAGQLSLANAGFLIVGAYTAAIFSTRGVLAYPLDLLPALGITALLGVIVGYPALRLRGVYLALATIGFGEVAREAARNLRITGGALGIFGVPPEAAHWHVYFTLVVVALVLWRLWRGRVGRAWRAIREDESAAAALGIDTTGYKVLAFTIGAAISGLAGGLLVHFVNIVTPSTAGFNEAVNYLAYAVVGGYTTVLGPMLGAALLYSLPEILRPLQDFRLMTNGLLLVMAAVYLPRGLSDPALWAWAKLRWRRSRDE